MSSELNKSSKSDKSFTLTDKEAKQQEHLDEKKLDIATKVHPVKVSDSLARPKDSLIDLIRWVKFRYGSLLEPETVQSFFCYNNNIVSLINNKIVIDGSFLRFCEEKDIIVKCIYNDAIASWSNDHGCEGFISQGIYEITHGDLKFLHCALFHKGNQYEDEVSFFILVRRDCFHEYIKLRDEYTEWYNQRDRSNLEVFVVGGEPIEYEKNVTWDDIYLPEGVKEEIKDSIEGFLKAENFYKENRIPWKMGMLLYGHPGCGKTSIIKAIISQYNFKPVTVDVTGGNVDELLKEAFFYASKQAPALLYLEDINEMLTKDANLSNFLQLMDGIEARNGLYIIGTANDISKLKSNVTDRPSRFDRKICIPLPNHELSLRYLKEWFKNVELSDEDFSLIAHRTVEKGLSYAHLKDFYLSSVFNALKNNRKLPSRQDVELSFENIIRDKEVADSYFDEDGGSSIGLAPR